MKTRERLLMDPAWRFFKGDIPFEKGHGGWTKSGNFNMPPIDPPFDDTKWRRVDLPHDFVVEGEFNSLLDVSQDSHNIAGMVPGQSLYAMHGFLPSGVGWYRKNFFLPLSDLGRRLWIEFDGVARDCTVWMNKHYLGRQMSGYTPFQYDVSDIAVYGGLNTLAVRVDAGEYEGWFYEGGGIYRHVWLLRHDPVHIAPYGVFVSSAVSARGDNPQARLTIRTRVKNESDHDRSCCLTSLVVDDRRKKTGKVDESFHIKAGDMMEITQTMDVPSPRLWSLDAPLLYRLTSTVTAEDREVDSCQTMFGIRTIRFDPQRGFFLNDRPLKLKGVCCHQDHAGVGAALPDRIQEFRIRKLKEMGCNAWRCSHNPPAPELLDACDRLGMLVMDENRLLSSSPEYLKQLETLVLRDRNHPSVILWSLANEEPIQASETGTRIAATLKRLVRKLDPTRPVTLAMNGGWGKSVSLVVDVQGCNYTSIGDADQFHERFPDKPVLFSESASTVSTRGIYANDADKGYVSAYDLNKPFWGETAEKNWLYCVKRPFIAGTFVWTGFDYRGEPTPYGWPCINSHFGIVDMCGFPKDNFYYYQSWWSEKKVLHLFPHWNWPGREGEIIDVWVHSNCEQVELFLNGRSLGRKKVRPCRHLEWKVRYVPGVLTAKGWWKGKAVMSARVATTGAPAGIKLMPDRKILDADGEDVALITAVIVDARGRVVPIADNQIDFSVSGKADILGVGNGDPSSHEPDKAARRRVFNGFCQMIVQASRVAGSICIKAQSPGLKEAALIFRAKPAPVRPCVVSIASPRIGNRLEKFECTPLRKGEGDIKKAALARGVAYHPVANVKNGFCDIRSFHHGKDGLLYIRAIYQSQQAGAGILTYGSDGPVKVWVNDTLADCQPGATNPAVEGNYRVPVKWKKGDNRIVFGLATNRGKAWGIFAGVIAIRDT